MNTEYKCVTTVDGIKDYIGDSRIVAFDFETSPDDPYREEDKAALDPAKAHIVGCSFSVKECTGVYVPVSHRVGTNIDEDAFFAFLTEFLKDKAVIKIAHNIAFESSMAYARGIVIQAPVYDTICAAQMTLKNNYEFRKLNESGLKRLAEELFGEPLPSFSNVTDGKHFDELDAQDAETVRYGSADSDFALRLYYRFNDWFERYLPKHRYIVEEIESPTAVYLGIMKTNGIPVNLPLMRERNKEAENEMKRIRGEIEFIIGDVNIGANCSTQAFKNYLYKDLGLPVLKTTDTNREAADDMAMTLLKEWCDKNRPELSQLFSLVQEYRKWGKIKSTYIDGYLKYLNPVTGRIHPEMFALSTDTGRMNCRNPNCFDDKTEILTKRGFVLFADLKPEDKVAEWENGTIRFVTPTEYICRPYRGKMIGIKNIHIDLMMTPEHRCLLRNRKNGELRVFQAAEYPADYQQIHAGRFRFGQIHLNKQQVCLLAAAQADGHYRDGGYDFSFAKARKYKRLKETLDSINAQYSESVKKSGEVRIRIYKGPVSKWLHEMLGDKKVFGSWLLDLDRATVENLLSEIYEWDGCFTRHNAYSSSVKQNADWVQILFSLTGKRAHLREYQNGNPNSRTNFQVDVTDKDYSMTTNAEKEEVDYQGNIYCVSVPSSFIVVRRNGEVAVTGNCQNMPRKTNDPIGVRNFIKAPEHHLILSLDFSQIELRVGAFYCRDAKMLDTYRKNGDIHAATTSVIFGVSYEEAQDKHSENYKEHRTIAKNVNFGTFYGLFPRGLQKTLKFKAGVDKSVSECEEILANLKHGYKGLTSWQEETKADVARRLYSETWLGRRRYLPGITSDNWGQKSFAERCALNTPIQGTAADILKLAIARILKGLPEREWLKPVLQIHDELTFIIPEDRLKEAVVFIRECMEEKPFPEFDLPLIAEASAGPTFGTMEELED